jgi:hypothetical protein
MTHSDYRFIECQTIDLSSALKNSCIGGINRGFEVYIQRIDINQKHSNRMGFEITKSRIQFGDVYLTNFHNFFVSSIIAPMSLLIGDLL